MRTQICHNIPALIACSLLLGLLGCNPTKRLADGEYLLRRNKIELDGSNNVDREGLQSTIRPNPNRRILGIIPFYLWAYNVPNPDHFESRDKKRLAKLEDKNEKRERKGKPPKALKPSGSWWTETVGEPPVLTDTSLVRRSKEQMRTYMVKQGWFNATVDTEVKNLTREKQQEVVYTVHTGKPYVIDSVFFEVYDPGIMRRIDRVIQSSNRLRSGRRFNIDELDAERTAITRLLRNEGYYDFNKDLLYFDVDTALGRHAVHLTLGLHARTLPYANNPDSLLKVPYKQYTIGSVTIIDRPNLRDVAVDQADTLRVDGYLVIDQNQVQVRPRVITSNILFSQGDFYRADRVTTTYRRLSSLQPVRSSNIRFTPAEEGEENTLLNCMIAITPAPKQSVSVEGRGTNRGGFLGIQGGLSYKNRNIFGGAEALEINLRGGLEAQQLLTGSATRVDDAAAQASRNVRFNTVEFGPEVALTFPKFLIPVHAENFAKSADPRTTFRANLNYQLRPDYERARSFASLTYRWSDTDEKQWAVSPAEISLISINKSDLFREQLEEINNIFLTNSFNDHFIAAGRVVYTETNQRPGVTGKNSFYFRSELESAGSLLRAISQVTNRPVDSLGSYQVFGINFAQYVKTLQDLRYFRHHNDKMSTAYRFAGGVGVPFRNLNVLPFEKSFFGGGANDIRAWEARTLGPGSFRDPERNFDKIGDILLEANVEYRFALIGVLEGALFVDAGNIWNIREDPQRPGANFELNRFWREIAVGTGVGVRFNFDFFIIRVDAGLQTRDPSLDPGERWLFQPKDQYNAFIDEINASRPENRQLAPYVPRWNLNLGIGYPF